MVKKLLALLVSAGVIAGGVGLFRVRHQLFRPNITRAGGTEVVCEMAGPADDSAVERACEVLRKRFDDDGSAGVVVRPEGERRVAILVPNGRRHDEIASKAGRLAHHLGRVEFRLLANERDDKDALNQGKTWFLDRKNPLPLKRGEPEGVELVVAAGAAKERYRWFRLSEGQAKLGMGRTIAPLPGGAVVAGGREVSPSPYMNVPLHIAHGPAGASPDYFVLCREPSPAERIGSDDIQRVRLAFKDARHVAGIEFTFAPEAARRLSIYSPAEVGGAHPRARSYDTMLLGGILDGEVIFVHQFFQPIRRRHTFQVMAPPTEAEEMTMLLRGGELPVKLKAKPVAERVVAPGR